jgi:ABC-type transporter Mla subunit MlaD
MALQDLTPQLRTRLSRMERAVGWFVILATALLVFGLGYYIYQRAKSKGWFTPKFRYETWLNNSAGLKPGDPVQLMGSPAGQITRITPNAPDAYYGLTVEFEILKPHYGYIWDDSKVKVSSDFLGHRYLEVTKGVSGLPTIEEDTNKVPRAMLNWRVVRKLRPVVLEEMRQAHPGMEQTNPRAFYWFVTDDFKRRAAAQHENFYTNLSAVYGLTPEESPALNDRLEQLANEIEQALPNILNLTNKIGATLDNASVLSSNLNIVAVTVRPAASNLNFITAQLNGPGTLGDWLLPTNVNTKLNSVMSGADVLVANANTNLANLNLAIINLANITSNLNAQVQANSNMLSGISKAVEDADSFVQGLKHHWLLRSAFKTKKKDEPPKK